MLVVRCLLLYAAGALLAWGWGPAAWLPYGRWAWWGLLALWSLAVLRLLGDAAHGRRRRAWWRP